MNPQSQMIDTHLLTLIRSLMSIKDGDGILIQSINNLEENFISKLEEMEKQGIVGIDRESNEIYHQVSLKEPSMIAHYTEVIRPIQNLELLKSFIPRSLLVLIVSQWDSFLVKFIKTLFFTKRELFLKFSGKIDYAEIAKYETIADIEEFILDQEIEDLMKKSHKFQIEWLSEKTDIKLMERPEKWKFFIELTERRNVCVHNDGRISKIYIENCKKSEIIVQKNLKVGDELSIDTEYLFSVCEYLIFTASKLVHAIWRKQIPADLDASIRNLVNLTVDLIERGYYVSAVEMCDFGLDWRGNLPEQIKLFLILNKAQSLKWLGKIEEMQVILNSIDWNTKSDTLQLPKYVLEERFEQAALCMKRIGSENTDLNSLAYESFPIFKEFRKSKEFLLSFKEIFGREFELLSKPSVYIGRLDQQDPPYRQ